MIGPRPAGYRPCAAIFLLLVAGGLAGLTAPGCGRSRTGAEGAGGSGIALSPRRVLERADDLAHRHRVAKALEWIEEQAPLPPSGPIPEAEVPLRLRQAALLTDLARPAEAASLLERLLPVAPGSPEVRRRLALARLEAGEPERALEHLDALDGAGAPRALRVRGRALLAAGRPETAAAVLAAHLAEDPWDDSSCLHLGRALARSAPSAVARALLERHREGQRLRQREQTARRLEYDGEEARALVLRGDIARRRGRDWRAMMHWNRAVSLDSRRGAAWLGLAELSLFLGRPHDAIPVLERLPEHERVSALLRRARALAGDAAPGAAAEAALRQRMRGRPLSRCVDDLLELARLREGRDLPGEARRLALFALRLRPGSRAARLEVLRLSDRPRGLPLRLWAAAGLPAPEARRRVDVELDAAGIDPELFHAARDGRPLPAR